MSGKHFGVVSPPVSGHLNPFGALGRELIRRGHRVTVFQVEDLERKIEAEGLEFVAVGQQDHPPGSLPESLQRLAKLDGLAALRFTVAAVQKTTEMMCRDLPKAVEESGVDALLVDQMEPAGGAVAERLGIPFVTVCNALPLNEEPGVPPPFTPWSHGESFFHRLRNRAGYAVGQRTMRSVTGTVQRYRANWGLPKLQRPEDSFSRLAQISQLSGGLDFPRRLRPENFHYVGPLRGSHSQMPFPWEKLDGRPLVYASLGTLQNRRANLFRLFAEACDYLNLQLALTHGGGLAEEALANLPGKPIVVSYAPQLKVLQRASLTLTHAGLNTVLDSISCGVPLVAIPITYEQPAIASRVRWAGVGEVVGLQRVSRDSLVAAMRRVLEGTHRSRAQQLAGEIRGLGGTISAAQIVENSIR